MTKIMGIVNVTPDSFSDGGAYFSPRDALQAVERMIGEGAEVIDIGAESTRPGALPVSPEEEWQRLEPVLKNLPHHNGVQFSIDTRHAETAMRALALGADWINDVSGFSDAAMAMAVKDSSCQLVMMHSLTVPADKSIVMQETNVVTAVLDFAQRRINALQAMGIPQGRIIFDPGVGFGKTPEQSRVILRDIQQFKKIGVPLLVGHSRKSFLGVGDRDALTLAVSRDLIRRGVDYLRVHDVAAHKRLLAEMETATS